VQKALFALASDQDWQSRGDTTKAAVAVSNRGANCASR
jgi:hypothetical protein